MLDINRCVIGVFIALDSNIAFGLTLFDPCAALRLT